jgi:uncharacterized DUF497 family protein
MRYSWDDDKGARNLRVHGIAFDDAVKKHEQKAYFDHLEAED